MAIKPEKNRKYFRKCSNNFAADCNWYVTWSILQELHEKAMHHFWNAIFESIIVNIIWYSVLNFFIFYDGHAEYWSPFLCFSFLFLFVLLYINNSCIFLCVSAFFPLFSPINVTLSYSNQIFDLCIDFRLWVSLTKSIALIFLFKQLNHGDVLSCFFHV